MVGKAKTMLAISPAELKRVRTHFFARKIPVLMRSLAALLIINMLLVLTGMALYFFKVEPQYFVSDVDGELIAITPTQVEKVQN